MVLQLLGQVVVVDTVELAEVGAGRNRVVEEAPGVGYVNGEGPDSGGAVKDGPCLMFLEIGEFDTTKNLRQETAEPIAGDLEARKEIVFCEVVADEVED
jgi:hypothetical protein